MAFIRTIGTGLDAHFLWVVAFDKGLYMVGLVNYYSFFYIKITSIFMSKEVVAKLVPIPDKRDVGMSFLVSLKTKLLLKKLAKIHETSATTMFEAIVLEKSKEFGLIESRD